MKRYPFLFQIIFIVGLIGLLFPLADTVFIQQLNKISTTVLAVLTGAYVIFTYEMVKSTRSRPIVFASLYSHDLNVYLSIKNIGNRPAYDLNISITPSLDSIVPTPSFKGSSEPMLNQSFMPPNHEVSNFITSTVHILHLPIEKKKFIIKISYRDDERHSYADKYHIDLSSIVFENKFLKYDELHFLEQISKELSELKEVLKKE